MNMKKFSLKPLGDSCIRKVCKSWFFIGLIMAFCVSACSDDDDNAVTPKFPEKQNIICNAGKTTEFTFETNTNWSLTSSAIWCKFEKDGVDEFILSGEAGKQTVTIIVTDDDQKIDNISVAKLELTMGGQTIVIGEVTRSAVNYELKIYDENGNEIDELEVGYDTYIPFKVKANFRFAATNLPSWIELEGKALVGPINKEVKSGLRIIGDGNCEKYPVVASDKNTITFSDDAGKAFFPIKVSYKGMPSGKINITTPSNNKYDWTVSMDGKSFTQGGSGTAGSSNTTSFKNRLPFTIKSLNDDYEIVFLSKGWDDDLHIVGSNFDFFNYEWMRYEGKNGNISLIVDEYIPNAMNGDPKDRTGYVLAFPRAEYESIKDNLEKTIVDNGDITYKYAQNNLLVAFTQKEVKAETEEKSFLIKKGGWEETTCTKVTDSNVLDFINEYFNTKDVYSMSASAGEFFIINPLLPEDEWVGNVFTIDEENNDFNDITIEAGMDGDGMYIGATLPENFNKTIFIIFNGTDYTNKKALMITPN